jgi:uncharacterized protein YndB with AHSA1/START domain
MSVDLETFEEGPSRIRLVAHYGGRTPADVYRDWVEPRRIQAWWGPEATVDLEIGGEYVFRWKKINAVLRGKYVRIETSQRLDFSWAWDDEPDRLKQVSLCFSSDGKSGTLLEVIQGPYSADARDRELRQQHLDGWRFHLPKLDR